MKKLKFGVIGDVHGRDDWKKFINDNPQIDRWVFVGDYVDSHDISNTVILHNLKEIIEFKKKYPDKVILLIGNHDVSYIYGNIFNIKGFRPEAFPDLCDLFRSNIDLFQIAYQYKEYLFTHAGVTNAWLHYYGDEIESEVTVLCEKFKIDEELSFVEILNLLQHSEYGRSLIFSPCRLRCEDPTAVGGLVWVDKRISSVDMLDGYKQVVGHTWDYIFETFTASWDSETTITFVDVPGKFYEIEI